MNEVERLRKAVADLETDRDQWRARALKAEIYPVEHDRALEQGDVVMIIGDEKRRLLAVLPRDCGRKLAAFRLKLGGEEERQRQVDADHAKALNSRSDLGLALDFEEDLNWRREYLGEWPSHPLPVSSLAEAAALNARYVTPRQLTPTELDSWFPAKRGGSK